MAMKIRELKTRQLRLFDQEEPGVALTPPHKTRLAILVEALLLEIAAAFALEGAGDDQDHA
jgi:hypothetical protein